MNKRRYGPYKSNGNHLFWVDVFEDGSRKSTFVHRELMEQSIGRSLLPGEVVHHKNEDPSDNRLANLEVKSIGDHIRVHRTVDYIEIVCVYCGAEAKKLASRVRHNQNNQGKKKDHFVVSRAQVNGLGNSR